MFIHTPTITSNDCEGAGEVFTVQVSKVNTLLKIFKGSPDNFSIGDNVNPCPIDK